MTASGDEEDEEEEYACVLWHAIKGHMLRLSVTCTDT